MNRYLTSFFITLILYVGLAYALFMSFFNDNIKVKKAEPLKTISLNNIQLKKEIVKPKEVVKPKQIIEPKKVIEKKEIIKPKKVEPKKIKPKKIVKKKIVKKKVVKKKKPAKKPLQKKVIKKEIVKKIIPKKIEEVIEKPVEKQVESPGKEVVEKKIEKKVVSSIPQKQVNVKQDYLKKHLAQIRKHITNNVKYPKRAKRFNIQDVVKVKFTLLSNGQVKNIQILSGNKHLHKATINAIKKASSSFPRVSKDIDIIIPIEYKLI